MLDGAPPTGEATDVTPKRDEGKANTATRSGGETYKRVEEEGRKRDTGMEKKRESCIINFFAS